MAYLIQFSQTEKAKGRTFTVELLRSCAEADGLAAPPDPRAWGGIIRVASKNKLIRFVTYSKNVGRHRGDCKVWEGA